MKRSVLLFLICLIPLSLAGEGKPSKSNITVKEWNIDASSGVKILDHVTVYNNVGRKVEEAEYNKDGLKWKKKYEYSSDGTLLRELVYNSSGKLDNYRKFEFNSQGRKTKEYIYSPKGKLTKYKVYEYSASQEKGNS